MAKPFNTPHLVEQHKDRQKSGGTYYTSALYYTLLNSLYTSIAVNCTALHCTALH